MDDEAPGSGETLPGWPKGVEIISIDQLGNLGVDQKTKRLYWHGKELQIKTVHSLNPIERTFAGAASAAAVGLFILELGKTFWGW